MTTKYAVFNAETGTRTLYDTTEEATQAFWDNLYHYAKRIHHSTVYVTVTKNEDGTETWHNDLGEKMPLPPDMSKLGQAREPTTKVEVL